MQLESTKQLQSINFLFEEFCNNTKPWKLLSCNFYELPWLKLDLARIIHDPFYCERLSCESASENWSLTNFFARCQKSWAFSGVSIPLKRIFSPTPACITVLVSPSLTPTTLPENVWAKRSVGRRRVRGSNRKSFLVCGILEVEYDVGYWVARGCLCYMFLNFLLHSIILGGSGEK